MCSEFDKAIADYTAAIRLDPKIKDFSEAIQLNPQYAQPYQNRGEGYTRKRDFARAAEDFSAVIRLNPKDADAYNGRGNACAELGHWDEAAADFTLLTNLAPNAPVVWAQQARVCLERGDQKGYRAACAALLERFGQTKDAGTADLVAWICVLAPSAVPDPRQPVGVAARAVAGNPKSYSFVNTLGAAHYRAGAYEASVRSLTASMAQQGKGGICQDWLFLSMAHQRLGNAKEARQWRDKAAQWIDKNLPREPAKASAAVVFSWGTRLELQLLFGEIESIVGASQAPR
jgi:tetratricopeptide (TPR) repeat protein